MQAELAGKGDYEAVKQELRYGRSTVEYDRIR